MLRRGMMMVARLWRLEGVFDSVSCLEKGVELAILLGYGRVYSAVLKSEASERNERLMFTASTQRQKLNEYTRTPSHMTFLSRGSRGHLGQCEDRPAGLCLQQYLRVSICQR